MANIKSAKKRIEVTSRQSLENKMVKSKVATWIKKFKKAVADGDKDTATTLHAETVSLIDSAVTKGVYHKNNANNKKAKLGALLSSLN